MKRLAFFGLAVVCILALAGCAAGESNRENPFGHLYSIDAALEGEAPDIPLIQLNEYGSLYICEDLETYDYELIGKFEPLEERGDPAEGPWQLLGEETQTEQYALELTAQGTPVLSYSKAGTLQWQCQLQRVDVLACNVTSLGAMTTIYPDWFYPDTFAATPENLIYLSGADISGKGTVKLAVEEEGITSLRVYEAYFTDGNVEYSEYTLDQDFKLSVSTRYESGKQFAIYRIPCGKLECWFYLNFA